jgi:hypothetical protein
VWYRGRTWGRGQLRTHTFLDSYFSGFLLGGETANIGAPSLDGGAAFGLGGTTFIQPDAQSFT